MFICDKCGLCCRNLNKSHLYTELDRGNGVCKYLEGNICSIYKNRPILCRVDESYKIFFKNDMSLDEYYRLNYESCIKLKNQSLEDSVMPLPIILGIGAAIAAVAGVGTGVHGAMKMKEAKDTLESADWQHKKNIARFEEQNKTTSTDMDKIGKKELEILDSFKKFSLIIEKIQNKPDFKGYNKDDITIPEYNAEELKQVSIGAGILLGGVGGAAMGTAGGFAAAGATTSAVMALGTASTGTAIASLSGVAATNATLAAIGGGSIAAGGGGIALGTTILGASTLGVGLLVGGIIFSIAGSSLSDKADEAWSQMRKAEGEIDKICLYMKDLSSTAVKFYNAISMVDKHYKSYLNKLTDIVEVKKKTDFAYFTQEEELITKNTFLLVGLLYKMCKTQLVLVSKNESESNKVNAIAVNKTINDAETFLGERGLLGVG